MKKQVLTIAMVATTILLFDSCQKKEDDSVNPIYNLSDDHSEPPKIPNGGGGNQDCNVYRWNKNTVTWKVVDQYPNVDVQKQKDVIAKSFANWAQYIPLNFKEAAEDADIEIRFVCGEFTANSQWGKIDKKVLNSQSIGYGFYSPSICFQDMPSYDSEGDIYLYACMNYSELNGGSYPLELLVTHEIGHALGFKEHNPDNESVMNSAASKLNFTANDIRVIQNLYGSNPNAPSPVPTTPTQPTPVPQVPVPTPQTQMHITPSVGAKSNDFYSEKNTNSCMLDFFNGVNFEILSLSGNTVKIRVNKYSTGSFQKGGKFYIKTGGICGTPLYTHTYQSGGSFDYSFTIFKGQNLTMTITSDTDDRFNLGEITAY
ncbi:MAG: hypothetical protein EAZ53_15555 [Bacteroidetes bacterium]|nr:MAG: hypothetical protein EAZ53_15555 [Bacteroidota bacterium]